MRITGLTLIVLSSLMASVANGSTFDAVTGFSSANPSGPWTYGTGTIGASFTQMTVFTGVGCNGLAGTACWQPPVTSLGVPIVLQATSGTTISNGTYIFPTDVLVVHPGASADTIVNWTAPTAGTYDISGVFELLDIRPTGVVASIYNANSQLFTATLTGPGAVQPNTVGESQSFSLVETVTAGTVISFGVNNDGNYLDDSTGFDATITSAPTATPEPGSMFLLMAGLVGAGLIRLRRIRLCN